MTGSNDTSTVVSGSGSSLPRVLGSGLLLVLVAVAGAFVIRWLNAATPTDPARVVIRVAFLAVIGVVLPISVYLGRWRSSASPGRAGLILLASVGTALLAFFLAWISYYVQFPADILIWSEGDFINDIIKLRTGYPLFTPEQNNDSFHYLPGAQLSTYALARLFGASGSIPTYRLIQVAYCLGAGLVAVACYRRLRALSAPRHSEEDDRLWGFVAVPFCVLVAINSLTNPFVYNLHNDALAQLVSVTAYFLMVSYAAAPSRRTLAFMAVIPALGFLVKQNGAIWAPLYCLYFLLFDQNRSIARAVRFGAAAFGVLGLVIAACFGIWGAPFWYWNVTVLRGHPLSPLLSFEHLLDAWPYYAIGLFAGLVMLRGAATRRLLGPWVIWLVFFLIESYTSGIQVMLNHMGPGSLIAASWFLAALTRVWSAADRRPGKSPQPIIVWARYAIGVAIVGMAYAGLGLVQIPANPIPRDAYRYVDEIEKEFAGLPADRILTDLGAWMHAKSDIVMKDRAPGIGVRGEDQSGDFSEFLSRLEHHYYQKILVRNLDQHDFWYDEGRWRKSSGIRAALHEYYQEAGKIRGVNGEVRFLLVSFEPLPWPTRRYGFQDITVLVPKAVAATPGTQ